MTTPGSVATVVTAPRVPAPGGLRDIGHRLVGVTTPSMEIAGVTPLALVSLARAVRCPARDGAIWYDVSLAGAAVAALSIASLSERLLRGLGGYVVNPLPFRQRPLPDLGGVAHGLSQVLELFGADFAGASAEGVPRSGPCRRAPWSPSCGWPMTRGRPEVKRRSLTNHRPSVQLAAQRHLPVLRPTRARPPHRSLHRPGVEHPDQEGLHHA